MSGFEDSDGCEGFAVIMHHGGGGRAGTLACHVWSAQSPRARAPSALLILPVVYIVIVLRGSTSRVIEGHVNSCVTARLQRFLIKIISTTTTLFVSKLK